MGRTCVNVMTFNQSPVQSRVLPAYLQPEEDEAQTGTIRGHLIRIPEVIREKSAQIWAWTRNNKIKETDARHRSISRHSQAVDRVSCLRKVHGHPDADQPRLFLSKLDGAGFMYATTMYWSKRKTWSNHNFICGGDVCLHVPFLSGVSGQKCETVVLVHVELILDGNSKGKTATTKANSNRPPVPPTSDKQKTTSQATRSDLRHLKEPVGVQKY